MLSGLLSYRFAARSEYGCIAQLKTFINMEIKFYGVCVANGYRTIRAIEPSDVNDFLPRMRRKNDEIEQLTGERPWGLFTNERVEQINDLCEFVPCGYNGNPAIRDIATKIEIFVLNN